MHLFKIEEIAVLREDISLEEIPEGMGMYIGEDVEIVRFLEGDEAPPDEPGYEIVVLTDKRHLMCRQKALRKKKLPGEEDGNQAGSWDIIEDFLGFKVPGTVKA